MASLGETVAALTRAQRAMARGRLALPAEMERRLHEVAQFGANPGALRMFHYRPEGLAPGAALVVALHGCGQTAAGYDNGTGWSVLAERFGFAVVLAEQARGNNAGTCFNWFNPEDVTRGLGEAASVRAMVAHEVAAGGIDARRVFVTGLSAGGAFANALLAVYPEVFAGGAIVAGLPYGAAANLNEALEVMRGGRAREPGAWGDYVREAAPWVGRAPRVAIWQGSADHVVAPANATALVAQWRDVHGLGQAMPEISQAGRLTRTLWRGGDGAVAVELCVVEGLGHGVPISAQDADPARRCGSAAPFIIEAGISSSYAIAQTWRLTRPLAIPDAAPARSRDTLVSRVLRAAGLSP